MPTMIRLAASADARALVGLMAEFYAEAKFTLDTAAEARALRRLYSRAGYVDSEHALLVQPLAAAVHVT
jgi:hypothetical protein